MTKIFLKVSVPVTAKGKMPVIVRKGLYVLCHNYTLLLSKTQNVVVMDLEPEVNLARCLLLEC